MNGGTPYEKDVFVEASAGRKCEGGKNNLMKACVRIVHFNRVVKKVFKSLFGCVFSFSSAVFQQMLQGKRQPKLNVKLKSTNSRTRSQLR